MTTLKCFALAMSIALAGCTELSKEARDASDSAKQVQYDTWQSWRGVINYRPPPQPQLAQRRYCYKQLIDIVCYDSPQDSTSPIVAIQQGKPGRLIAGQAALDAAYDAQAQQAQFADTPIAPTDHVIVLPSAPATPFGVADDEGFVDSAVVGLNNCNAANAENAPPNAPPNAPFACAESSYAAPAEKSAAKATSAEKAH
jgi:hypothetical protein